MGKELKANRRILAHSGRAGHHLVPSHCHSKPFHILPTYKRRKGESTSALSQGIKLSSPTCFANMLASKPLSTETNLGGIFG